jgi:hypothetical protein
MGMYIMHRSNNEDIFSELLQNSKYQTINSPGKLT